jgi:P2-related tail formation protein
MSTTLDNHLLEKLLPPNLATLPDVQLILRAVDPEFQDLVTRAIETSLWPRIDDLDEPILNLMAEQYHLLELEGWGVASVNAKRDMLKDVLLIYRRKGTPWSVERILQLIGFTGVISEWFNADLDPYLWNVDVTVQDTEVTQASHRQFNQLIDVTRPVRSPLNRLKLHRDVEGGIYLAPTIQGGTLTVITQD